MRALVEACEAPDFPATPVLVFSDKENAAGLDYAREKNIPVATLSRKGFASREAYDTAVADIIAAAAPEIICFAGYMRLVTPAFIDRFPDKILNIHPSLLPSFKGLHAQKQALEAGVKIAGCTVHIVRPETDSGPIIAQAAVPVLEDDTEETLSARILEREHKIYAEALRAFTEGRITVTGSKTMHM